MDRPEWTAHSVALEALADTVEGQLSDRMLSCSEWYCSLMLPSYSNARYRLSRIILIYPFIMSTTVSKFSFYLWVVEKTPRIRILDKLDTGWDGKKLNHAA